MIIGTAGNRQVYCLATDENLPTALLIATQRISQPSLSFYSHLLSLLCGRPNRPHYRFCPSVQRLFQFSRFSTCVLALWCLLCYLTVYSVTWSEN